MVVLAVPVVTVQNPQYAGGETPGVYATGGNGGSGNGSGLPGGTGTCYCMVSNKPQLHGKVLAEDGLLLQMEQPQL